MKGKLIAFALTISAAMIAPLQAGGHHGGGGGFAGPSFSGGARAGGGPSFSSVRSFGGGPSFRSMPMRSFGGNRMIYSGERFSSVGRQMPRSMEFRPRQFGQANPNRGAAHPTNRGSQSFANVRAGRNGQFRTGSGTLRSDWRNHVVAQHSGTWHRDWDRHHDHFFHHHRFVFINGFWWGFDFGWDPWWGYPYDYYGYEYGYPYPYSYGYEYDPGYSDSGVYDDRNDYADQSGNSIIGAVQQRLATEGYYHGQIDGVFGSGPRAAIAEYQSNHGLRRTGALTNETLAALGLRRVAS